MTAHLTVRNSLLLLCVLCAGAVSSRMALAADSALAMTANDAKLKWGGCPAFMPKACALAVLRGDPSQENADVLLKIPAKSTIPMHIHTSAERMILTEGELHLTYEGRPMSVLKPGSYAYGPAKLPHKAICVSARRCILFIAFEQPVDAILVEAAAK